MCFFKWKFFGKSLTVLAFFFKSEEEKNFITKNNFFFWKFRFKWFFCFYGYTQIYFLILTKWKKWWGGGGLEREKKNYRHQVPRCLTLCNSQAQAASRLTEKGPCYLHPGLKMVLVVPQLVVVLVPAAEQVWGKGDNNYFSR